MIRYLCLFGCLLNYWCVVCACASACACARPKACVLSLLISENKAFSSPTCCRPEKSVLPQHELFPNLKKMLQGNKDDVGLVLHLTCIIPVHKQPFPVNRNCWLVFINKHTYEIMYNLILNLFAKGKLFLNLLRMHIFMCGNCKNVSRKC